MKDIVFYLKFLRSALRLIKDPNRLAEVFDLGRDLMKSDNEKIQAKYRKIIERPELKVAFEMKYRLGKISLDNLAKYPEGSLGNIFSAHMKKNGLDPESLPTLEASSNLQYFFAHVYETHDIWHVMTGFDTDVAGEMGLQAFYLSQLKSNLALLIIALGLLNTLFYSPEDLSRRMDSVVRGWTTGKSAKDLFGIDWKTQWARPLTEIKRELNIA